MDVFFTGAHDGHLRVFDSDKFIIKDDLQLNVIFLYSLY